MSIFSDFIEESGGVDAVLSNKTKPAAPEPSARSSVDDVLDRVGVQDVAVRDHMKKLAHVESSGGKNMLGPQIAKGMHAGDQARGMFQIMPKTFKDLSPDGNVDDIDQANEAGARYFLKNLSASNGDLGRATAAHLGGPGQFKNYDNGTLNPEISEYVRKVMGSNPSQASPAGSEKPKEDRIDPRQLLSPEYVAPPKTASIFSDAKNALGEGVVSSVKSLVDLGVAATESTTLESLSKTLGDVSQGMHDKLSTVMQQATEKTFAGDGENEAWSDPYSYLYTVVNGFGSMIPMIPLGGVSGLGVKSAVGIAGRKAIKEAATIAAKEAGEAALKAGATKEAAAKAGALAFESVAAPMLKKAALAETVGYTASGSAMTAGDAAGGAMDEIRGMKPDALMQSPVFAERYGIIAEANPNASPEEIMEMTTGQIAAQAGREAGAIASITTLPMNVVGGKIVQKILHGGAGGKSGFKGESRVGNIGRAAAAETPSEFGEEYLTQVASNVGVRDTANPNKDITEGAMDAGVKGAIGSGGMSVAAGIRAPAPVRKPNSPLTNAANAAAIQSAGPAQSPEVAQEVAATAEATGAAPASAVSFGSPDLDAQYAGIADFINGEGNLAKLRAIDPNLPGEAMHVWKNVINNPDLPMKTRINALTQSYLAVTNLPNFTMPAQEPASNVPATVGRTDVAPVAQESSNVGFVDPAAGSIPGQATRMSGEIGETRQVSDSGAVTAPASTPKLQLVDQLFSSGAKSVAPKELVTPSGERVSLSNAQQARWLKLMADQRKASTKPIALPAPAGNVQESDNGTVATQSLPDMVAPSTPQEGNNLQGSGDVSLPAPVGDTGRTGDSAEVVEPGLRPDTVAGDEGIQRVGQVQQVESDSTVPTEESTFDQEIGLLEGQHLPEFSDNSPHPIAAEATHAEADSPNVQQADPIVSDEKSESEREIERGRQMMGEGIDQLIALLGGKMNMTPEEESALIPVMSKIFRGASIMGYVKFKDAARYVVSLLRDKAPDVADKLSIDNLQAGYINIARDIGGDKKEALQFDSVEELMADPMQEKKNVVSLKGARKATNEPVQATAEEFDVVEDAKPSTEKVRSYTEEQARKVAKRMTLQGLPSEARPSPANDGTFIVGVASGSPEQVVQPKQAEKAPEEPTQKRSQSPIMQRDDIVGAIMRATGGNGIASDMAMTLAGDTANNLSKVRGLFTNKGQQDMDDLAMLLREQEGYDVKDGDRLAELIREAAAGNYAKSMERTAQDKADEEEKKYRDNIREKAGKLGIKTAFVKFGDLETRVLAAIDARRANVIARLDDRSMKRFNELLDAAHKAVPEEEVDAVLMDVHNQGLSGRNFWNAAKPILRTLINNAQEKKNAANTTTGRTEPAEAIGDGRGTEGSGSGNTAVRGDQAAPGESFGLEGQTLAEVRKQEAQRQADEEAAKREEKPKTPNVTVDQIDLFNTQGSVFDKPAEQPPSVARGEIGAALTKQQRKEVLKTLVDVYKQNGAPKESKGIDGNGNERSGYAYSPEFFVKSDITGAMVRYYVTLPDGRVAHPTELFPEYSQSDIDSELESIKAAESKKRDWDKLRLESLNRRSADTLNEANRLFWKANPSLSSNVNDDFRPALLTNGKQFIRTMPESVADDIRLLGDGWEESKPGIGYVEFRDGEMRPFADVDKFLEQHVFGKENGALVPDTKFMVGELPSELVEKIKPFIDGFNSKYAKVRIGGRSLKHTDEGHHSALVRVIGKLPDVISSSETEVLHNPKRENSAFLVYRESPTNALVIFEIAKNGNGSDVVNIIPSHDRALRQAIGRSEAWLDGRHTIVDRAESTPAEGEIPVVQPSNTSLSSSPEENKPTAKNEAGKQAPTSSVKDIRAKLGKTDPIKLQNITVRVPAVVEETGETVTVKDRADQALNEIEKRINLAKGLLECLAS